MCDCHHMDCLWWIHVIHLPIFFTLQNGRHFPDDIFRCIFLIENVWLSIKISLNCVPKGPIYNIPALVPIMAWRRPGDKQLSQPTMISLPTHLCVKRPQWVKGHLDTGYRCPATKQKSYVFGICCFSGFKECLESSHWVTNKNQPRKIK